MGVLTFDTQAENQLHTLAQRLADEQQFDSIEWRLSQHGEVLSSGVAGSSLASQTNDAPIYRIYSMTKPIVSFVAMQLIDEGKLQLSDAVSQYIPAMGNVQVLQKNGALEALQSEMTIEHLLTHTAGFSYDFLPDCPIANRYREVQLSGQASRSLAEVIGMLTTLPLASHPGEHWQYSVATDVLAHVLENVSEQSLPDLLHSRVFEPLNMTDTAFFVPDSKLDRLLPMFGSRELGQVMVESDEPNVLMPLEVTPSYPTDKSSGFYRGGHGLFSTLDDYTKFMHVLQTSETLDAQPMLSKTTYDLMWSNRIDPTLQPLKLAFNVLGGYGWNLMGRVMLEPDQSEFRSVTGEGGWAGAASTYFWIDRKNDLSGIAMSQYIGSSAPLGVLMQHAAYGMFTAQS